MVGEIRDIETAEIAIKASQTGHLVLSTLHTNSAAETIVRLSHMGIEAFNLASSLSLIIAQRLARKLCAHCKVIDTSNSIKERHFIPLLTPIYRAHPEGCNECTAGYSGRLGIYEVMPFDDHLAEALMNKASTMELEAIAKSNGMETLQDSGIEKLTQGLTSYQELQRVLYL